MKTIRDRWSWDYSDCIWDMLEMFHNYVEVLTHCFWRSHRKQSAHKLAAITWKMLKQKKGNTLSKTVELDKKIVLSIWFQFGRND